MMATDRKTLLVIGGTSDIGRATALRYAENGWRIQLAGRDPMALERDAADIRTRTGAEVSVHRIDILETPSFAAFVDSLGHLPDTVACVAGLLGEQPVGERDLNQAALVMRTNYEGPALFLGYLAHLFLERGHGTIIGVSYVAGERGRASNYIYGSAKAGLTAFLSGLRQRLSKTPVRVVTVKPGFVRTRMTSGMKLPGPLTAEPVEVAAAIYRADMKGNDIVYVRPVWRLIMAIIRSIPEPVFKKTRI